MTAPPLQCESRADSITTDCGGKSPSRPLPRRTGDVGRHHADPAVAAAAVAGLSERHQQRRTLGAGELPAALEAAEPALHRIDIDLDDLAGEREQPLVGDLSGGVLAAPGRGLAPGLREAKQ